ncbi:MAG: FAD-dependent oxidoreductase [Sedimentitalea sp.]
MDLNGLDIAVIGGGIAGLASALCLRQRGANVAVFEQAEAITEVGAGLQITPNGAVVLNALGLGPDFARIALRAKAVVLRDYRRRSDVLRLDLARLAPDQVYGFVHRADLIDVLADAARAAGVSLHLSSTVQSVSDAPRPQIACANGTRHSADLVIGADGVKSVLRGDLNGTADARFTGQVAWRALVPGRPDMVPEAQVFMGPGRHLVAYPLRDGALINLVAVEARRSWAAEGWTHFDDAANLRAAFSRFGPAAQDLLQQVENPGLWGLFRHPVAQNWHAGARVLVGDAAHPTLPFLAQGANMALEDAWCLAASIAQGASLEQGLSRYQTRRQDRVRRIIRAANGNAWKYHLISPIREPAHFVMWLGGKIAPARMVGQFDWLYGYDVTAV